MHAVTIRAPRSSDRDAWLTAVRRSRRLHRPWVSPPSDAPEFAAHLRKLRRDTCFGWLVVERDSGALAGVVNVSEIVRGGFLSAYLGYYAFSPLAGRGYLTSGLRLVLAEAFATLRLHRLEANIQPDNRASVALVKRLGFSLEGFSPRYLKIGGRWRDHERWALRREDFSRPRRATEA